MTGRGYSPAPGLMSHMKAEQEVWRLLHGLGNIGQEQTLTHWYPEVATQHGGTLSDTQLLFQGEKCIIPPVYWNLCS